MSKPKGLTACPDCAEKIRADADRCKHCGARIKQVARKPRSKGEAELKDVPDVGPVGLAVAVGLGLGFAVGTSFEGASASLFPLAGAGIGAAVWWAFDRGPLAGARRSSEPSNP